MPPNQTIFPDQAAADIYAEREAWADQLDVQIAHATIAPDEQPRRPLRVIAAEYRRLRALAWLLGWLE